MNYQIAFEMLREMVRTEYEKASREFNRHHPSPFVAAESGEYQRGKLNAAADIYNESNRLLRHIKGKS
ncbi:hypothetical protein ACL1HT_00775 [Corynebacterium striatum]|nr:hypothetical protein [Corynebacterium striatum]HAT1264772.1 hypothetical protein [Corynebacterium striatum]HAT1415669.1 hypothetical protein [Corynebacterium striatum]HAT1425748.1 hypothetical protein [Corynebacterium striatum]HAT1430848.1 hypothetical protein [Corynebacterium striatum]